MTVAPMRRAASSSIGILGSLRLDSYRAPRLAPFLIVFAAIAFNFVLCLINTNLIGISASTVIGFELVILSAALVVSRQEVGPTELTLLAGVTLYLCLLSLIRSIDDLSGFDPKIIRDFVIPIAFYLLGRRVKDVEAADSFVLFVALLVSGLAIFEYFFLDTYLNYLNIIRYYIARGTVESARLEILSSNLFVSGIRPEGRTLFPFLGDHRVSSIFLEPVSPGTFAVILFYWALVRSVSKKTIYFGLFGLALFLTIMADNRFGANLCVLAVFAAMLPAGLLYSILIPLPFLSVFFLLCIAFATPDGTIDNSFFGRLLSSGRVLSRFDLSNWLGVGTTTSGAWDSGYAYTIGQIGIIGFAAFWVIFMFPKARNSEFGLFRNLSAMYFTAILCVSYGPFTIKTAALLWFLMGVLSVRRAKPAAIRVTASGQLG